MDFIPNHNRITGPTFRGKVTRSYQFYLYCQSFHIEIVHKFIQLFNTHFRFHGAGYKVYQLVGHYTLSGFPHRGNPVMCIYGRDKSIKSKSKLKTN